MLRKALGIALGLMVVGHALLPMPSQAQVSARHLAKEALEEENKKLLAEKDQLSYKLFANSTSPGIDVSL